MPQLTIIWDASEPPLECKSNLPFDKFVVAKLPLADDLSNLDIYETARKLAELLLEQIAR